MAAAPAGANDYPTIIPARAVTLELDSVTLPDPSNSFFATWLGVNAADGSWLQAGILVGLKGGADNDPYLYVERSSKEGYYLRDLGPYHYGDKLSVSLTVSAKGTWVVWLNDHPVGSLNHRGPMRKVVTAESHLGATGTYSFTR